MSMSEVWAELYPPKRYIQILALALVNVTLSGNKASGDVIELGSHTGLGWLSIQ